MRPRLLLAEVFAVVRVARAWAPLCWGMPGTSCSALGSPPLGRRSWSEALRLSLKLLRQNCSRLVTLPSRHLGHQLLGPPPSSIFFFFRRVSLAERLATGVRFASSHLSFFYPEKT